MLLCSFSVPQLLSLCNSIALYFTVPCLGCLQIHRWSLQFCFVFFSIFLNTYPVNLPVPKNVILSRKSYVKLQKLLRICSINKPVFQALKVLTAVSTSYSLIYSSSPIWPREPIPSGKSSLNQPSFPCQNIMPNIY